MKRKVEIEDEEDNFGMSYVYWVYLTIIRWVAGYGSPKSTILGGDSRGNLW